MKLGLVLLSMIAIGLAACSSNSSGGSTNNNPGGQGNPTNPNFKPVANACLLQLQNGASLCFQYGSPRWTNETAKQDCDAGQGQTVTQCQPNRSFGCELAQNDVFIHVYANQQTDAQLRDICQQKEGKVVP